MSKILYPQATQDFQIKVLLSHVFLGQSEKSYQCTDIGTCKILAQLDQMDPKKWLFPSRHCEKFEGVNLNEVW